MDSLTLPWVHLVGAYLFIGTMTSALGLLARLRWQGYEGEFFPKHPRARIFFSIGILIGIFLWPLALLLIPLARRYLVRRKVNRILGHCEHADAFTPFCEACGKEQEGKKPASGSRDLTADRPRDVNAAARVKLAEIQRRIDERVKAGVLRPPSYVPRVPPAPRPATPEELEKLKHDLEAMRSPEAPVGFLCTRCGIPWPGFPHAVDADQKAVCRFCAKP